MTAPVRGIDVLLDFWCCQELHVFNNLVAAEGSSVCKVPLLGMKS